MSQRKTRLRSCNFQNIAFLCALAFRPHTNDYLVVLPLQVKQSICLVMTDCAQLLLMFDVGVCAVFSFLYMRPYSIGANLANRIFYMCTHKRTVTKQRRQN